MQSNAGPPYAGAAGRTRTERVHLVAEGGGLRTVEVYRVINTATHPELKALALAGQLHRLEDGRELAVSFVYHDPQNRKLALVVPGVLAHLEMKEWARLMSEIAEDTAHAVPSYVRDCVTVVGLGALELFLETGVEPDDGELTEVPSVRDDASSRNAVRDRALTDRERLLMEREREVGEQEQSLIRLAGTSPSAKARSCAAKSSSRRRAPTSRCARPIWAAASRRARTTPTWCPTASGKRSAQASWAHRP